MYTLFTWVTGSCPYGSCKVPRELHPVCAKELQGVWCSSVWDFVQSCVKLTRFDCKWWVPCHLWHSSWITTCCGWYKEFQGHSSTGQGGREGRRGISVRTHPNLRSCHSACPMMGVLFYCVLTVCHALHISSSASLHPGIGLMQSMWQFFPFYRQGTWGLDAHVLGAKPWALAGVILDLTQELRSTARYYSQGQLRTKETSAASPPGVGHTEVWLCSPHLCQQLLTQHLSPWVIWGQCFGRMLHREGWPIHTRKQRDVPETKDRKCLLLGLFWCKNAELRIKQALCIAEQ